MFLSDINFSKINIRNSFHAFNNYGQTFIKENEIKGIGTAEMNIEAHWKPNFILDEEKLKIKSHLVIYPWPTQIYFGDSKHEKFWEKFSKQNNIHLINLYEKFTTNNSRKFIFDNFIYGDIHWNKNGTKIVFDEIINLFELN